MDELSMRKREDHRDHSATPRMVVRAVDNAEELWKWMEKYGQGLPDQALHTVDD